MNNFAEILRQLRVANGFTQQSLAKKLGIHQSSVSYWERGLSRPEYENLILLADIFDVSLDEMLGRKGY